MIIGVVVDDDVRYDSDGLHVDDVRTDDEDYDDVYPGSRRRPCGHPD
ncbi:MAG: hypothetical protein ACRDKE_09150 [Solirubrobacterales bacterium]